MLTKTIKSQVFSTIISMPSFLGHYSEYDGLLTFLNKIWDLKELSLNQGPFETLSGDINQHMIRNDDWTYEYLFKEKLNLIDGDEKYFILFMEAVVNPTVRKTKDEIIHYVSTLNAIIAYTGYKLILSDYFEGLPVYLYKNSAELNDLPIDIIANKIPIYLATSEMEINYPAFILTYDRWDDFGYVTMCDLTFCKNATSYNVIGKVKIMKLDTKSTWSTFSERFTELSIEYCSLGQKKEYYTALKETLGSDFNSFLLAIRDVAIFPKINEQFENDEIYKTSLIRENIVERLVRTIRYEIEGIKPNEYFKFNYTYKPPYANNEIPLNFDFEYNTDFEHRIYALIGKNGTGKTRILSSLAKNLSEKEPANFTPRKPVYGKVFTVSYSFFDKFEIPNPDASFNYIYCGLKKSDNTWKNEEDLLEGFYISVSLLKKKNLENDWYLILKNFINQDILDIFFVKGEDWLYPENYVFDVDKFHEVSIILSSGQSIILFMISEILSQIRFDSLILFDEPETHLHPNAISSLLNTLFDLVKKFQSFCVIATHSPLIIQEIPSRNIFVIERENDLASVRSLERESFGENLTVITQDIFGNRDIPRHFIVLIEDLILKGKTYVEIIAILESDDLPVTSNIRLYIKSLLTLKK